jgi:hypothetical protein
VTARATKGRLLDDILVNPSRYHRSPLDVVRDRRFANSEKLAILDVWERDAKAAGAGPEALGRIASARAEIEGRREKGDLDA